MSGCIDLEVHYQIASMGSDIIPSAKHTCSFWCLQPHHVTWGLHSSSVDALADIHGRSHNFPLIHPREVLLAGHWVTMLPIFFCVVTLVSPPVEVGLHGVGLVHLSHTWWMPIHKGMPTSDMMRRSQFWWTMHDIPHWFITSYEVTSVAIWCTTSHVSSSHLSLIFTLSLKCICLH